MKCLEKDRNQRYATATGLQQDIEYFLTDEPVGACPPSVLYQFRKFAKRHKSALSIASVISAAILIIVAGLGWVLRDHATRQNALDQQIAQALEDVGTWHQAGNLSEAVSAITRAEGLLASGGSNELRTRVASWRADLDSVKRLQEIRLTSSFNLSDRDDESGARRSGGQEG